ncbi:RadC family protein [Psychromonas antarctica]|uniref:RadC family protein n=1 Tax=Psychromonas antarctica TaxID=67573 RepID=UPI001EE8F1AD|nr:DNA repair protein RadC [Psychromonas antarctica]MCG6202330.1 DNA repair protein RadC [Psychromonas antarctica]
MHTKTNQVYTLGKPMTEHQILERAAEIIATKFISRDAFTDVKATKEYLTFKLANYEKEVFAVMLLNTQHQLIEYRELFFGTIDSASIHPREVVKAVLEVNASAVIFAHNHPSGIAEPSEADKRITTRLTDALGLIDVRVLDHIVVGKNSVSFAERGLI